jgi:hypothetical protein
MLLLLGRNIPIPYSQRYWLLACGYQDPNTRAPNHVTHKPTATIGTVSDDDMTIGIILPLRDW